MTARLQRVAPRVALALSQPVVGWHEGGHASRQIGRSHEFHDLREYVRGDNVADIDWRATARTGQVLIKRFTAQRQATVMIAAATGRDLAAMASATRPKHELALDAAASVASVALAQGDRVAMAWVEDGRVRISRAHGRHVQVERLLGRAEDACHTTAAPADTAQLLDRVGAVLRNRAVVVVLTDDLDVDDRLESALRRLTVRHDILFVTVGDLDPTSVPDLPLVGVGDRRRLPSLLLRDPGLAAELAERRDRRRALRVTAWQRLAVHGLDLEADDDVPTRVVQALRRWTRARR